MCHKCAVPVETRKGCVRAPGTGVPGIKAALRELRDKARYSESSKYSQPQSHRSRPTAPFLRKEKSLEIVC